MNILIQFFRSTLKICTAADCATMHFHNFFAAAVRLQYVSKKIRAINLHQIAIFKWFLNLIARFFLLTNCARTARTVEYNST